MAAFGSLTPSTAYTGPLVFLLDGAPDPTPPVGTISASDPAAAPTLSANGQAFNFTTLATGTVTLTWTPPVGSSYPVTSCDFTDQVVHTFVVSFGQPVVGTTA